MVNIILQHYTGSPGVLEQLSFDNIRAYAEMCGAEYRRLDGDVYKPGLAGQCQKLYMLDPSLDDFDVVVMLDADMFARKGMTDSIFEVDGIGVSTEFHKNLVWRNFWRRPFHVSPLGTYWGGAIWRLNRKQRAQFRNAIRPADLSRYNTRLHDEGVMHRAARRAGIKGHALPGGERWAAASYATDLSDAALIHIRRNMSPTGPRRAKMKNLEMLIEAGIV